MRLLKSCGNGRTVDDGDGDSFWAGLAGHLYKDEYGIGGKHVLSRTQEIITRTIEVSRRELFPVDEIDRDPDQVSTRITQDRVQDRIP